MEFTLPLSRETTQKSHHILAENIADTIRGWLDTGRMLESKGRKIRAGDIMILVRKRTNSKIVDSLFSELKNKNIPCMGMDRMRITESIAVMDLMALAKFLLLPDDDLTLATILKSPLIPHSVSEDVLFNLCYNRGGKSVWQRVQEKQSETADHLKSLLAKVDFLPPYELFSHILQHSRKQIIARLGEDANDPIDEFLNLALEYEKQHSPTLQGFIHWIENGNIVIKRDMEQGKNEVRILTVHGSKGLQAPIVILPDTATVPNKSTLSNIIWLDDYPLYSPSEEEANELAKERKERVVQKQIEEYRRLLYVALTRAEDEVYIATDAEKTKENSWYDLVDKGFPNANIKHIAAPQQSSPKVVEHKTEIKEKITTIPDWIFSPVAKEPSPPNPLSPSRPDDEPANILSPLEVIDNKRYERGTVIHKLLQYLPDIEEEKRDSVAKNIVANCGLSEAEKNEAVAKSMEIIAKFGDVFSGNSMAEVPVSGVIDGRVISGQIDRLIITDEKVVIIDFKTNRQFSQEIVKKYEKQMSLYRQLLTKIYPDKSVETYLLWTEFPKIVRC